MRDEKEERKKQAKVKQTNKAKQHSTPKAVTFPRKNELPQVGLEPTTLYTLDRALYQLSYRGSSAGWAQISHLIVHLMNRLTINCTYMYMLYLSLLVFTISNSMSSLSPFITWRVDIVACTCTLGVLVVCLTLLAPFFLPSHLSLTCTCAALVAQLVERSV